MFQGFRTTSFQKSIVGVLRYTVQWLSALQMVAVLGLYEPFTHERTIVVWCVSGDGVAMLSPLWGRYGNYYSVPCHEVLVQTRICC